MHEMIESFPRTKWGIAEPSRDSLIHRSNAMDDHELDLVIVPGVAFTRSGSRLGHGRGIAVLTFLYFYAFLFSSHSLK
jgi:5-formyltetrahydrofolate cyclo-ligase